MAFPMIGSCPAHGCPQPLPCNGWWRFPYLRHLFGYLRSFSYLCVALLDVAALVVICARGLFKAPTFLI
jgi:hypothetical protein